MTVFLYFAWRCDSDRTVSLIISLFFHCLLLLLCYISAYRRINAFIRYRFVVLPTGKQPTAIIVRQRWMNEQRRLRNTWLNSISLQFVLFHYSLSLSCRLICQLTTINQLYSWHQLHLLTYSCRALSACADCMRAGMLNVWILQSLSVRTTKWVKRRRFLIRSMHVFRVHAYRKIDKNCNFIFISFIISFYLLFDSV